MTAVGGEGFQHPELAKRTMWHDLATSPTRPVATLVIAYLLSITGSLLLAGLLRYLAPAASPPDFGFFLGKGLITVVALAVVSPFVETLILAGTTSLLLRWVEPKFAVLLSSLGWALAHSYQAPIWGLVIWWPFIIFTTLYVVWKKRSLAWGIFMPFAAHFLQNLLTSIAIGFPNLLPIPVT